MTEGNNKECAGLHKAYVGFREKPGQDAYIRMMEAFETDFKADCHAYLPVAAENAASMKSGGPVKWQMVGTPKGRMVALYTSREEVEKHSAPESVGVRLSAFVRAALSIKDCTGVLVNPLDGHHGVPIDRSNLEMLLRRASNAPAMPQLHPGVVSNAVYRLWEIAVGVPTAVYDVSKEVEALGGVEKLLRPVLEGWNKRAEEKPEEFKAPIDYLKAVLRDVVAKGFVYGAMALKHADRALDVDIDGCIDMIPDLRGDIAQNVDEYLVLISDVARSDMIEPNEEQLQFLLAVNVGVIAFGALSFGIGWGMAKDAESRGVLELAELRDRQQKWIEDFREKVLEQVRAQQKKKENNGDEDGK